MAKMDRRERQTTPVPTGMPWLLFPCGKGRKDQIFCTISSSSSSTIRTNVALKSIPELHKAEIRACYYGWLLLTYEDDDHLWILWNPISYESIKLPPLNKNKILSSIFTTSPQNLGCKVMLFGNDSNTIAYCQPGDQEWTKHDYQRELSETIIIEDCFKDLKGPLLFDRACLDGVIYAQTFNTCLVSIESHNQTGLKFGCVTLEQPPGKFCTEKMETYLVESMGELYEVYFNLHRNETFGIEVFRLDFSQKVWLPVENLDGRSIFVGPKRNSTSCLEAETGIRGNVIHFIMPKDKLQYMYDLEEQTILASLPCPRLQTPWHQPFWVMPDHDVNIPQHKINKALKEQSTELVVESQRDIDASADQYPDNFNLDILRQISKHLEPLDYLQFRATCRLFWSAAPATKWSITSIMNLLESPWLITFGLNKSTFSFTNPIDNHTYHMDVLESLQGSIIDGYKDGYLLMANLKTLFYFNPFTGMQLELPTPYIYSNRLSFSCSPSSPDCLTVNLYPDLSDVDCILPGYDFWTSQVINGDKRAFKINGMGVFHKGMFYYLGQGGNLGVLKEVEDVFSWEVLVKPEVPCNAFYHNYLMECDGRLMAVFVGRYGNWVKVFRLDPNTMSWERVRNLGRHTLFISNISSIAAVATSPRMENKVYFPRFYNQRIVYYSLETEKFHTHGSIVYYSLETEKFHTHGSDVALDNFIDTKEQLYCCWIEPGY